MGQKFYLLATLILFSIITINQQALAAKASKSKKGNKSKHQTKFTPSQDFYLKINLSQDQCEQLISKECFYRDSIHEDPYYHRTLAVIFRNKIIIKQTAKDQNKIMYLAAVNGHHQILTDKTLVTFDSKNGIVDNLYLNSAMTSNYNKSDLECLETETLYQFAQIYDRNSIIERSRYFEDKNHFNGLKELVLFSELSDQTIVRALVKFADDTITAVKDLRLCKDRSKENDPNGNLKIQTTSNQECMANVENNSLTCVEQQQCQDYLVVRNCEISLLRDSMK